MTGVQTCALRSLKANAVSIQLPIGKEGDFVGVIDLLTQKAHIYKDDQGKQIDVTDIPEELKEEAEKWREKMLESIAETDEELMLKFLDGEPLTLDEMKGAIRKATIANEMIPVMCGSAYKNKGVQLLLDAVVDYMPSPLDVPAIKGVDPATGEEIEKPASDDEPFSALAFKIITDPYVGKLAFFRVYSGKLDSGSYALNATKGKKERIGRILQMHADKREEISTVYSDDIAAC